MKHLYGIVIYLMVGCVSLPSPLEVGPDQNVPDVRVDASNASDASDASMQDMAQEIVDASTSRIEDMLTVDIDATAPCMTSTQCGRDCVDVETDPMHCGGCNFLCAFPNAQARCENGQCVMGNCDAGYFDQDQSSANGCELLDNCTPNEDCYTSCRSIGETVCEQGSVSCIPPGESCNAIDDDCDAACDEGALNNCRIAVARASSNGHAYHTDISFLTNLGYGIENANYFNVYQAPHQGMSPIFLCPKGNGMLFLTSEPACEAQRRSPIAEIGFWSPTPLCGAIPLFRLYQPDIDNHFYTTHSDERDSAIANLGYQSEGIAGYVWISP